MATTTTPPAAREPLLEPQQLERYADAIVRTSLGLSPDDTLFVQAHPEHRELAVALAESGYRAGARIVDIHYYEPRLQAARIRFADEGGLGPVSDWNARRNLESIKQATATVTVLGEADPDVLAGLAPDRVARDTMLPLERQKRFVRETKAGRRRSAPPGRPRPGRRRPIRSSTPTRAYAAWRRMSSGSAASVPTTRRVPRAGATTSRRSTAVRARSPASPSSGSSCAARERSSTSASSPRRSGWAASR